MGSFKTFMAEFGKLLGIIAAAAGVAAIAGKIVVWGSTITHGDEFNPLKSKVEIIATKQDRDHELWVYIAHRIDDVASQMNHQATTGRVNYVTPPEPPQVLGPVAAPKGNGP